MEDKIITDQKFLKAVSFKTTPGEVRNLDILERLKKSNGTAWTPGCGLAAIQIGIPLRFAWGIHLGKEFTLLNPEIVNFSNHWVNCREGCLSIPNKWVTVKRNLQIKYISGGQRYTATGTKAQIIQHEIDHMNGKLITDEEMKNVATTIQGK